jgi:hypothetical protein
VNSDFQQYLPWEKVVRHHKDKPYFFWHLHVSHDSFCVLLHHFRGYIHVTDKKIGFLWGGKIIPEGFSIPSFDLLWVLHILMSASFVEFQFYHCIGSFGSASMP